MGIRDGLMYGAGRQCSIDISEIGQYELCDGRQKFFLANVDALPKCNSSKCRSTLKPPNVNCFGF